MNEIVSNVANVIFIILMVIGGIGLLAFAIHLLLRRLRYNIPVEIVEIDATGQNTFKNDKGGIFFDKKTKNRLFWLKNEKVGLDPDQIPYVRTPKGKKVFLYQFGFKSFAYMTPAISNPSINFSVGDEDVSWALNAYERGKQVFFNSVWNQVLQYMPMLITVVFIIVLASILFKNIPLLKDYILAAKEAATEMARAKAGTVVVGG